MAHKNQLDTLIKNTNDIKVYESCLLQAIQDKIFNHKYIRPYILELFDKYDWLYDECCRQFLNNINYDYTIKNEGVFIGCCFNGKLSLNQIVELTQHIHTKDKHCVQELIYVCMRHNNKIEYCCSKEFFDYYCSEKIIEWLDDIHTPIILKCFHHYLSPEQELACLKTFVEDEQCNLIDERLFKYYKDKAKSVYFTSKLGV